MRLKVKVRLVPQLDISLSNRDGFMSWRGELMSRVVIFPTSTLVDEVVILELRVEAA